MARKPSSAAYTRGVNNRQNPLLSPMNRFGFAVAIVAILGLLLDSGHLYLWVFLLVFGLARLPEQAYKRWRARRTREPTP